MKEKIHPKTNVCKFECACGEKFENITTSGKDTMRIEICNKCHPFYTGKQKIVDAAGMVEKFNAKFAKTAAVKASVPAPKAPAPKANATKK